MKIIFEWDTPRIFGDIPAYHLWAEKSSQGVWICHQRNTGGAPISRISVGRQMFEKLKKRDCEDVVEYIFA